MNFGDVLAGFKAGKAYTRTGWNGKSQAVQLQSPDENSANTLPYIFIITVTGDRVPWVASHSDMLATDWEEVIS